MIHPILQSPSRARAPGATKRVRRRKIGLSVRWAAGTAQKSGPGIRHGTHLILVEFIFIVVGIHVLLFRVTHGAVCLQSRKFCQRVPVQCVSDSLGAHFPGSPASATACVMVVLKRSARRAATHVARAARSGRGGTLRKEHLVRHSFESGTGADPLALGKSAFDDATHSGHSRTTSPGVFPPRSPSHLALFYRKRARAQDGAIDGAFSDGLSGSASRVIV